jgi:prefoldin beta subunit
VSLKLANGIKVDMELTHPSLCGKLIKLVVGTGRETVAIQIHQDVLARNSEFFKRAMKPEWAELRDEPDSIDLSSYSPEDVKVYAHWLYAGTIPTKNFDYQNGTKSDPIWLDLANAYVFGEKIMDSKYQCAILETFAAIQGEAPDFPCAEAFTIIYDGTPERSPARMLLADMYAYGAHDAEDWKKEFDLLPSEALVDIMRAMVRVRREPHDRPWAKSTENYTKDLE